MIIYIIEGRNASLKNTHRIHQTPILNHCKFYSFLKMLKLNLYFKSTNQLSLFFSAAKCLLPRIIALLPFQARVKYAWFHTLGRIVPQHQHRIMGLNYLQSLGNKCRSLSHSLPNTCFLQNCFWNLVVNSTTGSWFMAVRGSYRLQPPTQKHLSNQLYAPIGFKFCICFFPKPSKYLLRFGVLGMFWRSI